MASSTKVRDALRDLVQLHFSPNLWLTALLMAVAVSAVAVLLVGILHVQPGAGWVPPAFREALAVRALVC
jgi:hypothetical protein